MFKYYVMQLCIVLFLSSCSSKNINYSINKEKNNEIINTKIVEYGINGKHNENVNLIYPYSKLKTLNNIDAYYLNNKVHFQKVKNKIYAINKITYKIIKKLRH